MPTVTSAGFRPCHTVLPVDTVSTRICLTGPGQTGGPQRYE